MSPYGHSSHYESSLLDFDATRADDLGPAARLILEEGAELLRREVRRLGALSCELCTHVRRRHGAHHVVAQRIDERAGRALRHGVAEPVGDHIIDAGLGGGRHVRERRRARRRRDRERERLAAADRAQRGGEAAIIMSTWPPCSPTLASLIPLYGICVTSIRALCRKSAVTTWFTLPTPAEPKLSLPGCARASATSARRSFSFAWGLTTMTKGVCAMRAAGTRSEATSHGSFSKSPGSIG